MRRVDEDQVQRVEVALVAQRGRPAHTFLKGPLLNGTVLRFHRHKLRNVRLNVVRVVGVFAARVLPNLEQRDERGHPPRGPRQHKGAVVSCPGFVEL